MSTNSYKILWSGSTPVSDVIQQSLNEQWIDARPEYQKLQLDEEWERALADAADKGRLLYDCDIVRLHDLRDEGGQLQATYGLTRYRDYVAHRPHARPTAFAENPDPLGTVVIPITADETIPFARRSGNVDLNAGRFFCFGGFVEAGRDVTAHGTPDMFSCAAREMAEEAGLQVLASDLRLISIIYDLVTPHPEAAFIAHTAYTAADFAGASSSSELADLTFVPTVDLPDFLNRYADDFTESLLGALTVLLGQS